MNPFIPAHVKELLSKPVSYYQEHQSDGVRHAKPLTNIAFILDCSGSMENGKDVTIEGFNEQVAVIKKNMEGAGAVTYTDVQFASEVNIKSLAASIEGLNALSDETYQPNGNTALLDAIGSTVAALLDTKGIHSADTATLVTAFTDGEENASRVYSATMVRDMVQRLEATGRWTFALVGPQQTVAGLADLLAVRAKNVAGYDTSSVSAKRRAFQKVAMANESVMYSRKESSATQFENLYGDDV